MILETALAGQIVLHALDEAPREACGLIAGRDGLAKTVISMPNVAQQPRYAYEMDHRAFVDAMFDLQRQNLSLIGIYHSHPDSPPLPSQEDLRLAYYPEVEYLIVSLQKARPELAAWRIRDGVVDAASLQFASEVMRAQQAATPVDRELTPPILISAAFTFIMVIVVAIALLPPPPPLMG